MDKLQAMEVFMKVVDAGGFTRAAEQLHMPKATVSTLVQSLENQLSVKLLNRTTRQVNVTADGAAYYEHCRRILADIRETEDSVSRTHASPSGRLRVEVPSGLGQRIIIPALPDFYRRYPDIAMEMGCSDRLVHLIEEGVDCAVRGGALPDSTLVARRIGILHFITCATPAYLAQHGRPAHPDQLADHECISYIASSTKQLLAWDFERNGESLRSTPPGRFAVNSSEALMMAGLAGLGIMQLPSFLVDDYLRSGELERVLGDWDTDPVPLHVVYPQNRHLSATVRAFVEWVAELFAGDARLNTAPEQAAR
jgi:LysR family transcriptional regulator for bpeEF and oprC